MVTHLQFRITMQELLGTHHRDYGYGALGEELGTLVKERFLYAGLHCVVRPSTSDYLCRREVTDLVDSTIAPLAAKAYLTTFKPSDHPSK